MSHNIIFDIDGTIADSSHRLRFLEEVPKNWDAFFNPKNLEMDRPLTFGMRALNLHRKANDCVMFSTGRPERTRVSTYMWIRKALGIHIMDGYDPIIAMRADDDRRPSHEVKRDNLHKMRALGITPHVAYEDRAADAAMYREEGLFVFQVAEGNY